MRMYFFDVTVKVEHRDAPRKVVVYKAARARDELTANRIILNQYLAGGLQVARIDRVRERCSRADIDYEPRTDPVELPGYKPSTEGNIKQIRIAAKALANAARPIL